MSKQKFTEGEWEVVSVGGVALGVGVDVGGSVFKMLGNTLEEDDPREVEEINANAHLISASKELLAACEAYLYGRKEARECEAMMREAIAKATAI